MDNLIIYSKMHKATSFVHPIHFDSLLLYEYTRKNDPNFYDRNPNIDKNISYEDGLPYPEDFPIEIIKCKDYFFYACSDCIYKNIKTSIKMYRRKSEDEYIFNYLDTNKKKIQNNAGSYKNYNIPIILQYVPYLIWFVRGDKEKIENLLQDIHYLGKKRTQGIGKVDTWEVKIIEEENWLLYDNNIIKTIPIDYLADNNINYIKNDSIIKKSLYIPPYWLSYGDMRSNYKLCYTPQNDENIYEKALNFTIRS